MRKKVLAVLLSAAILCSVLVTVAGAVSVGNFTDVKRGAWYYEYVDYVTEKNYMIGESNTIFAPSDNMTRAMFVTVLARVAGVSVNDDAAPFDDVAAGQWYSGSVAWAKENGITLGSAGNKFLPDANVTREDMATFMARFVDYYSKLKGVTHKNDGTVRAFVDEAQISAYAKEAVDRCRVWGLVVGYPGDVYGPKDFSTRSQVAAVISRLDWLVNGSPIPTPTPTYKNYTVQLKVNVGKQDVTLTAAFNDIAPNGSNDVTVRQVAEALIGGSNKAKLQTAYDEAFKTAKGTYSRTNSKGDVLVVTVDDTGSISVTKNSNVKDVALFLEQLDADYMLNKDKFVAAALDMLGVTAPSAEVKAAAETLFDDGRPTNFFGADGYNKLATINDFDTYYANLEKIVDDALKLYEAAGMDSAAFENNCFPEVIATLSNYGITASADASLAKVLGNDDAKVLTNYTASNANVATLSGNTSASYSSIFEYVINNYDITDNNLVHKLAIRDGYVTEIPERAANKEFTATLSVTVE